MRYSVVSKRDATPTEVNDEFCLLLLLLTLSLTLYFCEMQSILRMFRMRNNCIVVERHALLLWDDARPILLHTLSATFVSFSQSFLNGEHSEGQREKGTPR